MSNENSVRQQIRELCAEIVRETNSEKLAEMFGKLRVLLRQERGVDNEESSAASSGG